MIGIFGPTASGKTAVAEAIAALVPAEIVSADSMQVYRGLPILTNQPEQDTRLVGIWPLDHEASVAEYARLAHDAVDEILAADRTPVVVGGTGLYFRAALAELDVPPAPLPGARDRWARLYDRVGPEAAHTLLEERDSAAAASVHPNDRRRVVRALELADAGASLRPAGDRLWTEEARHPTLVVGLDVPRDLLADRIDERTTEMLRRGAVDEARSALPGAYERAGRPRGRAWPRDRTRVGARRGGDRLLRDKRRSRRRSDARRGRGRRVLPRRRPDSAPRQRPRHPDRPRGARLVVRAGANRHHRADESSRTATDT